MGDREDDALVRRAIRARGDAAAASAAWHGLAAAFAVIVLIGGGHPLPLGIGGAALAAIAVTRGVQARRLRTAQTAPLVMLLQAPARVERITLAEEDGRPRVMILAAGVSDHIVPPGKIDETMEMLRRRCPAAVVEPPVR